MNCSIPYDLLISVPCSQKPDFGRYLKLHEFSRDYFLSVFKFHCQAHNVDSYLIFLMTQHKLASS
jgi:hypothetical protein